jgi:hypothetical protein
MKPILLVGLIFALHACVSVVSAQLEINSRDGETPTALLGTVTFPLAIGDKWFYRYSSLFNGEGSVVRHITDTTNGGFRRVKVTTHFGDSTSVATEYWLYKDAKFFRTYDTSLSEYSYPLYVSSLKSDSSYSDPFHWGNIVTWHLTTVNFVGEVYASQILDYDGGVYPFFFRTITKVAQSIGLYYIYAFRQSGVAITQMDTCQLVGLLASGRVYGDTMAVTTGVHSVSRSSPEFALLQNYPNPFNPSTTITFELPKSSEVTLRVYDILGREVSVLVNERRDAGYHEVKFDGSGLSSGVYFYRIEAGSVVQARRLVFLR